MVRAPENSLPVRVPVGREIGTANVRDLPDVRTVRIHHIYLQLAGAQQPLLQQAHVIAGLITALFRIVCTPDDLRSIRGVERATIVSEAVCQLNDIAPVRIHRVKIEVTVADTRKHDAITNRRERRLSVVAILCGQLTQV